MRWVIMVDGGRLKTGSEIQSLIQGGQFGK
jgi:hypothetical protein